MYGYAAALVACWQGPGAPKLRPEAYRFDWTRFGCDVLDELVKRGIPVHVVYRAGFEAWKLMIDTLPTRNGVKAAEGFTEDVQPD